MIKSLPKILIVFSILIMPILLCASYTNAETYTCQNGNICSGTFDSTQSPVPPYSNYCKDACPSGYLCTKYDSTIGCVDQTRTAPAETTTQGGATFKPQVEIPGMKEEFGATDKTGGYAIPGSTASIAKYVRVVYKYTIGIVGILAAVVLMIGGVMWIVAGGSATAIGEAKSWIGASLTGLVLALLSYLILATINPALVDFKTTGIKPVTKSTTESSSGTGCCLGGDNTVTYYFDCKNDIASANCTTGLFPTSQGITRVTFGEDKKCKDGTGIAKLCE